MRLCVDLVSKEIVALMESTQHPLDAIAGSNALKEPEPSDVCQPEGQVQPIQKEREVPLANKSGRVPAPIPHTLKLSGLISPAIVLDDSLRVVWQNKMAIDHLWHRSRTANNGNPTPDIFELLFDAQFQLAVDNWRQWVSFFTQQAMGLIPADDLKDRIGQMNQRQKDVVTAIMVRQESGYRKGNIFNSHLRQVLTNGETRLFNVTAVDFSEGRLLAFVPVSIDESSAARFHSYDIERRYEIVRRHPNPVNIGFSVLSAGINNSLALETELLSDEYCRLMNDLFRRSIEIIERSGGAFFKNSGSGFSAYFLPVDEYDEETSTNAVKCALALRAQMVDMSREWKIRKSWMHEIELNMGIHRADGYVGILTTSLGESLTSFGSTLSIAAGLSRISPNGQIWATKNLINSIPATVQSQLRFGIQRPDSQRRPVLIPSSFADIGDLLESGDLSAHPCKELKGLAVTQIFDLLATA